MPISKEHTSSRGLKYKYLFSSPKGDKQTLLFLHGFPSTSHDWRHQIAFFEDQGYGVIAPDMLGYGETAKPVNPEVYKWSLMAADIIDILDHESINKAVVIGHDWGCAVVSRLANLHSERFDGYVFLAVPYLPPNPQFDFDTMLSQLAKNVGYEPYGYWRFFSSEGASRTITEHFDSFFSVLFSADPRVWAHKLAPTGALEASLIADFKAPLASYVTEEDKEVYKQTLEKGGAAPFCWYKVMMDGYTNEDDKAIPPERYILQQPVLFVAGKQDYVCLAQVGIMTVTQTCKALTIKEFDAGHWIPLETPKELNTDLLVWIQGLRTKA